MVSHITILKTICNDLKITSQIPETVIEDTSKHVFDILFVKFSASLQKENHFNRGMVH